jgi:hypothetical protein
VAIFNGTAILKFFLHISKEEQLARFAERLEDPNRNWKISESAYTERALWDDYIAAFEEAISATSTRTAPWYIVPSSHSGFAIWRCRRSWRTRWKRSTWRFPSRPLIWLRSDANTTPPWWTGASANDRSRRPTIGGAIPLTLPAPGSGGLGEMQHHSG